MDASAKAIALLTDFALPGRDLKGSTSCRDSPRAETLGRRVQSKLIEDVKEAIEAIIVASLAALKPVKSLC